MSVSTGSLPTGGSVLFDLPGSAHSPRADRGKQLVDVCELRLAPGSNDHAGCTSGYDHDAGKRHASDAGPRPQPD